MRLHVYSVFAALLVTALAVGALQYFEDTTPPSTSDRDASVEQVNAVLGNHSFRAIHGYTPTAKTPEDLRLKTHLAYVEALLRKRDVSHLSHKQMERRSSLLDVLHTYWAQGRFPRNTEVSGRNPVFMDSKGRLCAVGYLIAESAGLAQAEAIDDDYHLAHIRDIEAAVLDQWADEHGFTRRELAMIQPMYCRFGDRNCIVREQENDDASTLELAGLTASVSASIVNGVLLELDSPSLVGGTLGVAGGATSFGAGLTDNAEYPTISIAAGATSLALGTWSLLATLRGDDLYRSAFVGRRPTWRVAPTTITTVQGATRPGLAARISF